MIGVSDKPSGAERNIWPGASGNSRSPPAAPARLAKHTRQSNSINCEFVRTSGKEMRDARGKPGAGRTSLITRRSERARKRINHRSGPREKAEEDAQSDEEFIPLALD